MAIRFSARKTTVLPVDDLTNFEQSANASFNPHERN
jgi:hypothetical protein